MYSDSYKENMKKKIFKKRSFIVKVLLLCIILAILFNLSHLIKHSDEINELEKRNEHVKTTIVFNVDEKSAIESVDYDMSYQQPNNLRHIIEQAEKLYLNDKYLRAMKLARLHSDSKMAVDRATKRPLDECLRALDALDLNNVTSIRQFVDEYLYDPGVEIVRGNLTDWSPIPKYVFELKNQDLISFALGLNQIWNDLFKRVDLTKLTNGRVSSHLPMKHGFVVPGGRFLEIYYWDSYWTLEGLLVSGMFATAKRTLDNFIAFIEQFGFIPNGSRIYYLNRSHPPFFAQMLDMFYDFVSESRELDADDKKRMKKFVLGEGLQAVLKEYQFWMMNRSVEVSVPVQGGALEAIEAGLGDDVAALSFRQKKTKTVRLNIFKADTDRPRPESYFEDINSAVFCKKPEERSKLYMDLSTAAETGYDFSSRWFNVSTDLCSIQTSDLIPVDLNSVLYKTELIIAKLCRLVRNRTCSRDFTLKSLQRQAAMNALLFNETSLQWSDLNYRTGEKNNNFYISNLSPLFMGMQPPSAYHFSDIITRHMNFFDTYSGGIPVSLIKSEQQWDFPNAWAPHQHMLVKALLQQGERELALKYARKYFRSVHQGWLKTGYMFEKYDVREPGKRGSGGEYEVQAGFGWTNGVTISFIHTFRDDLVEL